MCSMKFSVLEYRDRVTICNEIFCQHRGVNFTLLQKYFKQDEHQVVRNFIKKYHDEIVRKPLEFLNLPISKMIELIQKYQLHVDVNNNDMITYLFWKEDHDEIRQIIKQIITEYREKPVDVPIVVPVVVPVVSIVSAVGGGVNPIYIL